MKSNDLINREGEFSMHTINVNTNVNTATRESDEQFKTDKYLRYAVTDGDERLDFIPALFFTPSA
jgi:hypothetical protein